MSSRRGNKRRLLPAQSGVEIDAANPPQELLLQKPLLNPGKRSFLIIHSDRHRGLLNQPEPEFQGQLAQENADRADNHQQQSAGSELILAAQQAL
jgi:hypothetical protein